MRKRSKGMTRAGSAMRGFLWKQAGAAKKAAIEF
jgi:hypothetical protein